MSATLATPLDLIESKLGQLKDSNDNPVAADEVNILDGKVVVASFDNAIAGYREALKLDEDLTTAYVKIAKTLLAIRATIILAATSVPDWSGQSATYKAIAAKVLNQAFDTPARAERKGKIERGVQNQIARGERELAIREFVLSEDNTLGTGVTAKGDPTAAMRKAMARQYKGQGVFKSGKLKGEDRLTLPVVYGGPSPDESHDVGLDEPSRSVKLDELLATVTTIQDGVPEFAPLTILTALHRLATFSAIFATAHVGLTGYADGEDCKIIAGKIEVLAAITANAVSGTETDAAVQTALDSAIWTKTDK